MKTVYVTKYWQTQGIVEKVAEVTDTSPDLIRTMGPYPEYLHKPYWHESLQEAKGHAELLRLKKIRSTQKILAKLEKLSFV